MSNILAIAHREMKAYFGSPIAYIVIGIFALLFGFALTLDVDRVPLVTWDQSRTPASRPLSKASP